MNVPAKMQPQTNLATRWSEPQLAEKLNALVCSTDPGAYLPVVGPNSAAALRDYLAAATPPLPSQAQVEAMLAKLAMALPKAQTSDAEAEGRLDLYWRGLKETPLPDLHFAFDKLIKSARFFPTVAEIIGAAAPVTAARLARRMQAQMILWKHEREWQPAGEPLTPAEQSQLASIVKAA